mgnify:FL=1
MSRKFFLDVDPKMTGSSQTTGETSISLKKKKTGWDFAITTNPKTIDEVETKVTLSTDQLRAIYRILTLKEDE